MFAPFGKNASVSQSFSDYIGITSATICLIHCLAAPFYIGFTTTIHQHGAGHAEHVFLEAWWDYVFLAIGFISVYFSSRHTHQKSLRILLWTAFSFLTAMILLEAYSPVFQFLSYAAAFILIIAHFTNLKKGGH